MALLNSFILPGLTFWGDVTLGAGYGCSLFRV